MPQIYALTDIGRQRKVNEDDVLARTADNRHLLAVADGMGGHTRGDIASDVATTVLFKRVEEAVKASHDDESILRAAIEAANNELRAKMRLDPSLSGMGTTVTTALIANGEATIANVGDSRAYHYDGTAEQVTVDQSLVQKLVNQGEITPAEAETHPQRNVVSQALGTTQSVDPDIYELTVSGTLLLCSDGLTEEVPDERITQSIQESDNLEAAAEALVDRANTNGGSDNVSVVLYRGEN